MNTRTLLFVVVALALAAGVVLTRSVEKDALERALTLRLASPSLTPDEAVLAARALRAAPVAVSGAARPEEALTGRARLRYLLSLGYTLKEQGLTDVPAGDDPQALAEGLERAFARERKATEEMIALAAEDVTTTAAFLLTATDPEVRRRAARTLGMLPDARALPALERALGDPDEGVRASAFVSGTTLARRGGDAAALAAFLEAGARIPSLAARAYDAAVALGGPRAVQILLVILETHEVPPTDRAAAIEAIRAAAGPAAAASMPADTSAASLRAWWSAAPK